MRIWKISSNEIRRRLDVDQFEFLNCPLANSYLTILLELFRARQEEIKLEMPLLELHQSIEPTILESNNQLESFEPGDLKKMLDHLKDKHNVSLRMEPKRLRRIQDRGVKRYLVRLSDATNRLFFHLEQELESGQLDSHSSIQFNLADVRSFLSSIVDAFQTNTQEHDVLFKVARDLLQARKAVEDASNELMRLDLWLSETAIEKPDREGLSELLTRLASYFDRYLGEVEERRHQCNELLENLDCETSVEFFDRVKEAWLKEIDSDPSRQGAQPPNPVEIVNAVSDFLRQGGILDERKKAVHQRLADVTGHLKRVLAEIVRRSQLIVSLKELSANLLRSSDRQWSNGKLDELFLDLWQPANVVMDPTPGVPVEQFSPTRPFHNNVRRGVRFSGATIRPKSKSKTTQRPALIEQMDSLNLFVDNVIFRGSTEVHVSEISLQDWDEVKLFVKAIRYVRLDRSHLRRRLKYQVTIVDHPKNKTIEIPTHNAAGCLKVPQMIFSKAK